ncbi:MAG: tetratricopeptide repeat protein [Verrucomicrobia bacterium]|jgi:tetratricopeptide (TPR) repeat protein|nr:tetratricopeptide repeat protein [Verrucomicrobiota bacterium]MBT7067672.1 tetratricopeptide repeat protein [Verrucomicrobiota bacterium]MBT7700131.1 tetratricopeptide repeat protein [Verrucomicrobiota bacterium]
MTNRPKTAASVKRVGPAALIIALGLPLVAGVLYLLGLLPGFSALDASDRTDRAVAHYDQLHRVNKFGYATAHFYWATVLEAEGRMQEAARLYREALRMDPDLAEAHYCLGNVLKASGRKGDAIGHYRQAIRLKPDMADAHYNLGNALVALGRTEEAIGCYRQAVRRNPDHVGAHNNLGAMYRESGRLADAVKQLELVLRLQPDNPTARENLRQTRAMMGDDAVGDARPSL